MNRAFEEASGYTRSEVLGKTSEELRRVDTERDLPISVIMGDVNYLKLSNDVFGHREGDKLLKTIAAVIRNACRQSDIVARWGGRRVCGNTAENRSVDGK